MSKTRWLLVSLICSFVAVPTIARSQADTTNLIHNIMHGFAGPNWNVFANGGVTTGERFLLVQALDPAAGQRSLQTAAGWNVGGGVGVDLLPQIGVRLGYAFTSSNMNYRTNNGNGSSALDIDDVARLKANTVSLDALKYMLGSRAMVSPYGSVGLQMTWWSLDQKSNLVSSNGAGTPFSISPLVTFGVQVKAATHWSGRLEAVMAGGKNPFTGKSSFQSTAGPTIDEPTSVNSNSFKLAAVYHFGGPKVTTAAPSMAQDRHN